MCVYHSVLRGFVLVIKKLCDRREVRLLPNVSFLPLPISFMLRKSQECRSVRMILLNKTCKCHKLLSSSPIEKSHRLFGEGPGAIANFQVSLQ